MQFSKALKSGLAPRLVQSNFPANKKAHLRARLALKKLNLF